MKNNQITKAKQFDYWLYCYDRYIAIWYDCYLFQAPRTNPYITPYIIYQNLVHIRILIFCDNKLDLLSIILSPGRLKFRSARYLQYTYGKFHEWGNKLLLSGKLDFYINSDNPHL